MRNNPRLIGRHYPWVVVGLSFLTVGVAFGCRASFAVFLIVIIQEFHWSRGATAGALLLGALVWSISAPFIGMLFDRYGPRVVLPAGSLIMAMGFLITSFTQTLLHFYIGIGVFMALGFAALPMSTHGIIISNWFVQKRGTAMGIVASGMGAGVLVIVPLSQVLISEMGWRQAYRMLALLLVVLITPLNLLFQRHRPEDVGLSPDSVTTPSTTRTARSISHENGWTLGRAVRSYRFWALAMGVFTGALPLHMILIHQVAAAVDAGFSKGLAAAALGLTGFFTSLGMILLGSTSDRIGREWAYTLGSLAMIFGVVLLLTARGPSQVWMLYSFALFFALGFASRQSLYPTIAADLFHGRHFGAINGTLVVFVGAASGMGPWLGGYLFDRFGNYNSAFWIANLLALLSVISIWIAGPSRVKRMAKE
ncbi:MAG: MFS transporter [Deltaproteobacteria bacterium]|nr:MFS transporter [Deltaproteobacteria bacterium]